MPKHPENAARPRPPRGRGGRPSQAEAAKVEARLLDAATQVFLERGFDGATFDQIAETAQAGKATLYARYAGKEALFTAVIRRDVDKMMQAANETPVDPDAPDRLRERVEAVLGQALSINVVSLMRVVIAAAPRFPALARQVHAYGSSHIASFLAQVMRQASDLNAVRSGPADVADETALLLVNLVFAPLMMEALLGSNLVDLRAEISPKVTRALALLHTAKLI